VSVLEIPTRVPQPQVVGTRPSVPDGAPLVGLRQELKYIARQPIFNAQKALFGYELLYRSGRENRYAATDPARATSSVVADAAFLHGLTDLARGHKLFINFPRELLTSGAELFVPSDSLVVELVEDIEPTEKVLEACRKMKRAGYTIALDDVIDCSRPERFIDMIDMIKVDLPALDTRMQAEMVRRYAPRGISLLAEKVETHTEFQRLAALGYQLFQGYFFGKPEMIARRDIPAFKWNYLRLLQAIYRPQLDPRELERIIKSELSLCYKLLRYLNSPVFGFRGEIRSVRHATNLLGEEKLKRWVTLLALASMGNDKPEELLVSCLLRACWCESMAPRLGLKNREGDLFLLGLFSQIDAILDQPMPDILEQLPVATDIKEALAGTDTRFSDILRMVNLYERADFDRSEELAGVLGIERSSIPGAYLQAMHWAHEVHKLS
jgi:c-di-GMP-related signal transduction protein